MTFLLISIGLVVATFLVVRPAVVQGTPVALHRFDGKGVLIAFAFVICGAMLLGLGLAAAFLAALMVKELGHYLGHRLAGDDAARLRLLPVPGGPAISTRAPRSDLSAFFTLLMGPGLGLAPMVAAFALAAAFAESAPAFAGAARNFALASGALNFVALLPLWPLPGGRLAGMVIESRFPQVGGLGAAVFAAFTIGLAISWSSGLLFVLGLVAALALALRPPVAHVRPRLNRREAGLAFAAYFATLGAFFLGGWWVLRLMPLGV